MNKIQTIILFLLFQIVAIAQPSVNKNKIIGHVNQEPVTEEEYAFFAQLNRHAVIKHFRNEYKLAYHANFWTDKSKGKTPAEVLRKMTIDTITVVKVQYILAKQYGIIKNIGFQDIKQYLEHENKYRREALNKNIVIYGPEQYTMETYFNYLTSNMIIKLKDYLVRNGLIVVDLNKGIPRKDDSIMHDDDAYYSKVHIANMQINEQYNTIIQQQIKNANVKYK